MKKIILSAVLILLGTSTVLAQDAAAIMQRYLKASNWESIESHTSIMMDMTTTMMGTAIPAVIIQESVGNKMRIEMSMSGQQTLVIINGDKGWIKAGGQVSVLPKQQLEQLSKQGDFLKTITWDTSKFNFTYIGEKDGIESVQIIPINDDMKTGESVANFDKETGLLHSININTAGVDMTVVMSDYKKFGTVIIPTVLDTQISGNSVGTVKINKFETNFPAENYLFTEPK